MKTQERQVYRDTYELFDGCCALCGSPFIQMHRKTYIGNVIPLCKKHHDLVHTNKKLYMDQLIEIINKKMGE